MKFAKLKLGLDLKVDEVGFRNLIKKYKPVVLSKERRGVDKTRERFVVLKDGKLLERESAFKHLAVLTHGVIIFECAHPDFFLAPDELAMATAAETPPTIASPKTPPPTSRHAPQVHILSLINH